MPIIRVVIFDNDGVISKTDDFNQSAFGSILGSLGLPTKDGWYKRHFFGRKLEDAIRDYLEAEGLPSKLLQQIAEAKRGFDPQYAKAIEPYPDAIQLIRDLDMIDQYDEVGVVLALASGARRSQIDAGFEKFGLTGIFKVVVTAGGYKTGKPAPDAYLETLRQVNALGENQYGPAECLVVEDAPAGIVAAKAAGMMCVAVTHTHSREELALADMVVDDLSEFDIITLLEG